MFSRGRILATAFAALILAHPAAGQVSELRLRSDNDAYRFWVPMSERPDQEYSNGLELEMRTRSAPVWGGLLSRAAPCSATEPRCETTTLAVGQKIFTPRFDSADPLPGERPYAGWLYARGTGAVSTPASRRAVGLEVGVTGGPSAASWVQTTLHRAFGFWRPQGWEGQIPFEPGIAAHLDDDRVMLDARAGGGRLAELTRTAGASLGNLRTELRAGARARVGYRMDAPWRVPDETRAPATVYLVGGVRGRAVAHDLFLDGSTLRSGPSVERLPWVGEWEAGFGFRLRRLNVEYRVVTRSREYRSEPSGHQYATFDFSLRRN